MQRKKGSIAVMAMVADLVCTTLAAFLILAGFLTLIAGSLVPALLMWILATLLWIASNQMPRYYQEEH